jgi:hypothetical protein
MSSKYAWSVEPQVKVSRLRTLRDREAHPSEDKSLSRRHMGLNGLTRLLRLQHDVFGVANTATVGLAWKVCER